LLYEDETILWRFALPRLGWWRRAQRPRLPIRPLSQGQITREESRKRQTWLPYRSWSRITSGVLLSVIGAVQYLPIRSIDFYYPEFQAANVRMFRDKSKMCFLEPTWSNLCRNLLNLLDKNISPMPTSPIISKRVLPVGGGLKCGNFGSQIGMKKVLDLQIL